MSLCKHRSQAASVNLHRMGAIVDIIDDVRSSMNNFHFSRFLFFSEKADVTCVSAYSSPKCNAPFNLKHSDFWQPENQSKKQNCKFHKQVQRNTFHYIDMIHIWKG